MAELQPEATQRSQLLPTFDKETQNARDESKLRKLQLLQSNQNPPDVDVLANVEAIHRHYEEADNEIAEAMGTVLGANDGQVGNVGGLMATAYQGDFLHVRRRAKSLRRASFPRRVVHTAARREKYHMDTNGYIAKRIMGRAVKKLKEASQ